MHSSLHLSDLSNSKPFNYSLIEQKRELRNSFGALQSQIASIKLRKNKVDQYSKNLIRYEKRLRQEKRNVESAKQKSFDEYNTEVKDLDQKLIELHQEEKNINERKKEVNIELNEQKLRLLELEDELRRINKTNEWVNLNFSMREGEKSLSREVMNMKNQIDEMNSKIKNSRQKVFHFQKEILQISEGIAPAKARQYQLQIQLEEEKANNTDNSILKKGNHYLLLNTVEEQRLAYKKHVIQKEIQLIQNRINKINNETEKLTEKILDVQSHMSPAIIESIMEQVKQYKEATIRKQKLSDDRMKTSHTSISKELEIGIERDVVHEDLEEVNRQRVQVETLIRERQTEIERLEKIIALDEGLNVLDEDDGKLDHLITQIRDQRIEENRLNSLVLQKVDAKSIALENEEIKALKAELIENEINIQTEINLVKNEIKQIERKNRKKFSHIEDVYSSIVEYEENNITVPPYEVQLTPKIVMLRDNIYILESEISEHLSKSSKIYENINLMTKELDKDISKLNLSQTGTFLIHNVIGKLERSLDWLNKCINTQIRALRKVQNPTPEFINEWDNKVLSTSITEAEDLLTRYQLISNHIKTPT